MWYYLLLSVHSFFSTFDKVDGRRKSQGTAECYYQETDLRDEESRMPRSYLLGGWCNYGLRYDVWEMISWND